MRETRLRPRCTKPCLLYTSPQEGNPRNSEGSFLRLKDGRIVFAYSRYSGTSSDDGAYCEIAAMYSSDNGETFSEPKILVRPDKSRGETNCMSVSLLELPNGDAGLFYLVKHTGMWSEMILLSLIHIFFPTEKRAR